MDTPFWVELCLPDHKPDVVEAARRKLEDPGNLGWLDEVARAGLGPLTYWQLTSWAPEAQIPSSLTQSFWGALWREAAQAEWQRRVLDGLASRGVSVALLNASWLCEAVYPQAALRPRESLDLFVASPGIPEAHQALLDLGLQQEQTRMVSSPSPDAPDASSPPSARFLRYRRPDGKGYSCKLYREVISPPFDVRDGDPFGTEGQPVLELARTARGRFGRCLEFSPELHLLSAILAFLTREADSPLSWIDLHWLARAAGEEVVEQANRLADRWVSAELLPRFHFVCTNLCRDASQAHWTRPHGPEYRELAP